jgi:hypothetical protein
VGGLGEDGGLGRGSGGFEYVGEEALARWSLVVYMRSVAGGRVLTERSIQAKPGHVARLVPTNGMRGMG